MAPFSKKSATVACLIFLILEALIFLYSSKDWDLQIYHRYAQLFRESSLTAVYQEHAIEYPPLAVILMLVTDKIAQQLPDCSSLGAVFSAYNHPRAFANFKLVYRLEMAIVTFLTFFCLLRLLGRLQAHKNSAERWERLLTFALSVVILRHAVFDRLDIVLGAALLLALGLMLSSRSPLWSFGVLALAVGYKVSPLALAPMWVVGSLPVGLVRNKTRGSWRRLLAAAAGRSLIMALLICACFLPFLLLAGPGCLKFFDYHRERGIEYGSTYAALLGVLSHWTDFQTSTRWSHGSWDIQSSLSPLLTFAAPLLVAGLLVLVTLLFLATARRASAANPDHADSARQVAGICSPEFIGCQLLMMLLFMFGNKVFSPQFVLWVIPLVPLVPLAGWPRRLFQGGFLGLCWLTAALNPRWLTEVTGVPSPLDPLIYSGPSAFGLTLLVCRTLVLMCLIIALTIHLGSRNVRKMSASKV